MRFKELKPKLDTKVIDNFIYLFFSGLIYLFILLINKISDISFPFGRISYQSIFTAKYLSNLGIWQTFKPIVLDPLTKTIENLIVTPYEQITILIIKFFRIFGLNLNVESVLLFLTLILFAIIVLLLSQILDKLNLSRKNKNFFMFFFLISPVTLFLLTTLNYHVFAFMLVLLLINIYLLDSTENKKIIWFSIISFILMFFGTYYLINILIVLGSLIWLNRKKEKESNYLKKLFFIILTLFVFGSLLFNIYIYERILSFTGSEVFFIYDLGGKIGVSIFAFVLFLIGLVGSIRKKEEYYLYYLFIVLAILNYILFGPTTLFYISPLICLFASETFVGFMKYRKSEEIIRQLTVYSIILGLLFSGLSFGFELENLTIKNDVKDCLIGLSSDEGEVVLSDYKNGYFIKDLAKKQIILDDISIISKRNQIIYDEMTDIFYGSSLIETKSFLKKYDVNYIMITDKMIYQDIWTKEDQGLVFVLGNEENFEKICSFGENGGVWEYIGE